MSIILRLVGILFLLPSFFDAQMREVFPGLPANIHWIFFGIGIVCFIAGAVASKLVKPKVDDSEL